MIEIIDKNKCSGCHACYNICPKNAIEMQEDEKGFKYPIINKEKCVECGLCRKACPVIEKQKNEFNAKAYACYNKDEKIRLESSSGGVFSLIAEYILENKGIIFGAAFDNEFKVKHIAVKEKDELYKLRTSKYVQSEIGNSYKEAKEYLEQGKIVLFTGTPCQLNGLYSFLNKKYENLYTQDIICHGVPSPKVWKKYLEYRKSKDNKNPEEINFRNKLFGWNSFSLKIKYDEDEYNKKHNEDLFMQAFLRDACLRESCYECSFKEKERKVDITLADFWGINNIKPNLNDNKGISLVITHTENGEKLLNEIKESLTIENVNFEESIKYNPAMHKSAVKPKLRDEFFENLDKMEFDKLVEKYTVKHKVGFIKRILRKCKKIVKKLLKKA